MTPTMDATTRRLVDFALAYRFEDLPASTVHAAKARLLDSAAVGLAAYAAPPVRILRKCAPRVEGPWAATLWGTRDKTTPDHAARCMTGSRRRESARRAPRRCRRATR